MRVPMTATTAAPAEMRNRFVGATHVSRMAPRALPTTWTVLTVMLSVARPRTNASLGTMSDSSAMVATRAECMTATSTKRIHHGSDGMTWMLSTQAATTPVIIMAVRGRRRSLEASR